MSRLLPFHLQLLQSFNVLRPPGHSGELHFGAEVVEWKPWKKVSSVDFILSFQSMYTYPSHWEHFPMLNTYRVSTFQIFNGICIYIYIYIYIFYVCIDYALLHFDSLPATRTKSSSLSLSIALSPLLSWLILRKEYSRITQTDGCCEK